MQITDEPRLTAGLSVPELPSLVVAAMALAAECDRTPGGEKTMSTTCGDFKITLMNGTEDEIKVTKFEYKDGSIWKTEIGMFGADGHQKIEEGRGFTWTRDLEGIGNENTQFRVTYQHRVGGFKWDDAKCHYTSEFTAVDNEGRTVTLTA
jgi:hypothetical protein